MIHNNTKYWAFTWSRNIKQHQLPKVDKLKKFLNMNSDYAVFQLERGEESGKEHYQGALILRGSRKSRSQVLELFKSCFQNVAGLTLSRIYDKDVAMAYACKIETSISGPYFIGRYEQYDEKMAEMKLKTWQQDLYDFLLQKKEDPIFRDRKIIWVEDSVGNSGKSWFLKYLRTGQRELVARKLPFTNVDRLVSFTILFNHQPSFPENSSQSQIVIEEIRGGGQEQREVIYSVNNLTKKKYFKEMQFKRFPDFESRISMEKQQAIIYQKGLRKVREHQRLFPLLNNHQQWLTAEEKSAINYFHGTGFYSKLQDPKTPPNLFDTRKT